MSAFYARGDEEVQRSLCDSRTYRTPCISARVRGPRPRDRERKSCKIYDRGHKLLAPSFGTGTLRYRSVHEFTVYTDGFGRETMKPLFKTSPLLRLIMRLQCSRLAAYPRRLRWCQIMGSQDRSWTCAASAVLCHVCPGIRDTTPVPFTWILYVSWICNTEQRFAYAGR